MSPSKVSTSYETRTFPCFQRIFVELIFSEHNTEIFKRTRKRGGGATFIRVVPPVSTVCRSCHLFYAVKWATFSHLQPFLSLPKLSQSSQLGIETRIVRIGELYKVE